MLLQGAKAIVTGGSRGIGFAIARKLLQEGAEVVITGRNIKTLEAACREMAPLAPIPMEWDAADVSLCRPNIEKAAKLLGGFSILVNNAGVLTEHDFRGDFFAITEEEWDLVQSVNLKGVFFMCQAAAAYMIEHSIKGHILNVASEMGFRPVNVTYGITKWGVVGMTKGLGATLAPKGIIVNGIAPGAITTEMMRWHPGDSIARESHPIGRFGFPEEMADLAAFLVSEQARNIVGHTVLSDGGSSLR